MERRRLGQSTLAVTPVGLGTWAIGGGDWILGWGPQSHAQSLATIRHALERGINWIDTSAVYGLGQAETLIAKALDDVPRGDRPHVFTTCGFVWDDLGNVSCTLDPLKIRREAEASLRRLKVDSIDLYQLDLPVGPTCLWTDDPGQLDEAWDTMGSLQREGKVRFIGVANARPEDLNRLENIAPVTSLQTPYSLLRRDAETTTFPLCRRRGIGVIAHSTIEAGLLSGAMTRERLRRLPYNDWRRRCTCFRRAAVTRAPNVVERIHKVAARHADAPAAVAVAWALDQRGVTAVAVGARRPDQIDPIWTRADAPLEPERPP